MRKFNVTFDIVSDESSEYGETAENGFICENASLSESVSAVIGTRTCQVDGNCISCDGRTITVNNGMEFVTGEYETRYLHRPANCTDSSWQRICRIVRVAY